MIIDGRHVDRNSTFEGDVCIIGGGPAGIIMALSLAKKSYKVVLLESGGEEYDQKTQDLYNGNAVGIDKGYLTEGRLRYLGGTSNHWGGYCSTFEEDDLIPIPGLSPGWPINPEVLKDYYKKAEPFFNLTNKKFLPEDNYDEDIVEKFTSDNLKVKMWHLQPIHFGERYIKDLKNSDSIKLLLYSNAVNIQASDYNNSITNIDIRTLNGKTFRAVCKYYVLACGGIENPRLLLLSNSINPKGIGNEHDLVGRYFMEHMQFDAGHLLMDNEITKYKPFYSVYTKKNTYRFGLTFNKEIRLRENLLNHNFRLEYLNRPIAGTHTPAQWLAFSQKQKPKENYQLATLTGAAEQIPNHSSRVYLNQSKDALGLNKVTLDWQYLPENKENMKHALQVLAGELGKMKFGRMQLYNYWQEKSWPFTPSWFGKHASGTTKMGDFPQTSVVDHNCKIHGMSNLFIAGSSVFPINSWQTPTYTIGALSIRLADHLDGLLAG